MKKIKAKVRERKAYACAKMSIFQFASNQLPLPNPSSSFFFFNGVLPWSFYEF